eukprot:SAG11_NODE_6630_length_1276_cov_1.827528_1_plen_110_part_10
MIRLCIFFNLYTQILDYLIQLGVTKDKMLCSKNDEAAIRTMRNAGFPAAEVGKGNWAGAVYIKSNGQTNPSVFVNEFGQTRQEYEAELAQYYVYDFKKISAVEGKEEQDI